MRVRIMTTVNAGELANLADALAYSAYGRVTAQHDEWVIIEVRDEGSAAYLEQLCDEDDRVLEYCDV